MRGTAGGSLWIRHLTVKHDVMGYLWHGKIIVLELPNPNECGPLNPGSYYTVPMNPDLMEDLHIFGSIGVFYIMGMGLIYISPYRRYPPHYGHGAWDSSLYRRYPYPIILLIHCAWHDQPWRHTKLEHL